MVGMEAAMISAVASGILKIVVNKIAPLLTKEYMSIMDVKQDLQELHVQVEEINCWLEEAGIEVTWNGPSFNWLKKLKEIAHAVDDVIDEFYIEAEKHDSDGSKHFVPQVLLKCKVAYKIKAIKKRFSAIVKQRNEFIAITNSVIVHRPVCHTNTIAGVMLSWPIVDEASILGRDQEKHQIISELVETNNDQRIKIASIFGLGGSGKTTLASLIFNDGNIIKKHFELRIWVHVSQEFDVAKLTKKLFEAIVGERSSERYTLQHMGETILENLTGKRYLLVLDDVWTEDIFQWEQFMVFFKTGSPGSKILLTTRKRQVIKAVESTYPFDLLYLSKTTSWELFQQSFGMAAKDLDTEFQKVGKEIVRRCGGVPLAIKVFAGILREKTRIKEWQAIRDSNLFEAEDKESRVSACLKLSYFNLPSHLKQCFAICSLFPKGHVFEQEQLIDLWIAHDMITLSDGINCMEHIGRDWFNYLVQMSFLQVVEEDDSGRVRCSMHDLVHDLALLILGDDISFVLPKETTDSTKGYRYFSLVKQPRNHPPKNVFKKARALYVSGDNDFVFSRSMKNAKHLRSITVNSVFPEVLSTILKIKNVRYFHISRLKCETLPESISDIWALQTLHVACSDLLELPKSIGKLQRLRTLNLSRCERLKSLPDSIGDCHMLLTIDLHSCIELMELPNSINRNENLRVLRLGYTKIERLPPGIATLGHLECLDLEDCQKLIELPHGMENLKQLEVLNLKYCSKLVNMPVGFAQLTRLHKLGLFVVGEGETSVHISELGNLARIGGKLQITNISAVMNPDYAYKACLKTKTNLQSLALIWGHNDLVNTKKVVINVEKQAAILNGLEPPSRIKDLQIYGYAGRQYAQWMLNQVDVRACLFPLLTEMTLSDFPNLKHLRDITELPCLREFRLSRMPALERISGGPFPLLVKLSIVGMPSLGVVWMATESTVAAGEAGEIQIGTCLSYLRIEGCPKLEVKPYFPSSLEDLSLLESSEQLLLLPGQCQASSSSSFPTPNFVQLRKLSLCHLPILSSPGSGSGHQWELLQHMIGLESLEIIGCDGLTNQTASIQTLTSLQSLSIQGCSNSCMFWSVLGVCHHLRSLYSSLQVQQYRQALDINGYSALLQLPEWLGELHSLRILRIQDLPSLSSLPQSLQHLTSLQKFEISRCDALHQLPECLGELRSLQILHIGGLPTLKSFPQSLQYLTSLEELEISGCGALHHLPEFLGELCSLRKFGIANLHGLTCLPQSMCRLKSLARLGIERCPGITCLPDWIPCLTALRRLDIRACPDLEKRCERVKGEDWHLISHIRISFGYFECANAIL